MHHRHKSPEAWKWRSKGRWMNPGTRRDACSSASSTSSKSSQSNQAGIPRVCSTVASKAKINKRIRVSHSWRQKRVGFKEIKRHWGCKWPKRKRWSRSVTSQRQSNQNQTDQQETTLQVRSETEGYISSPNLTALFLLSMTSKSMFEPDITCCQWLTYGAQIGNETRNIEFKLGRGNYMECVFCMHVSNYGCAFLNSGGGSLVVGVNDNGVVCGLNFSHEEEDKTRLQVDRTIRLIYPPVLLQNYSLQFLPVVKPGVENHNLKVLCLTFRPPPVFSEPTLYQNEHGNVYLRRDGSIEGPLTNTVILEWSRQMWSGKVEQLKQCLDRARSEMGIISRQVHRLLQLITPLYRIKASLQEPQRNDSSSSQSSAASQFGAS
ncbi:hypothetical protein PAMP_007704 [Pampus punctatissimus]